MQQPIDHFRRILRKWLDGSYTATDERDLRTLAKQDLDVREALDGYAQQPEADHQAALERLRRRMPGQPQAVERPFLVAYGKYLGAAASVALLIGAWWVFAPTTSQPQAEMADSTPQATTEVLPQATTEPPQGNTVASDLAQVSENQLDKTQSGAPSAALSKSNPNANRAIHITPSSTPGTTATEVFTDATTSTVGAIVVGDARASEEVRPSAPAMDKIAESDAAYAAETKKKEQPAVAPIASVPQPVGAKSKATAKPASPAPAAKDERYFETDRKAAEIPKDDALLQPTGGWIAFEQYLDHSLVYPREAADHAVRGSVRLTFWIDQQGRPTQIKVVRPLGYGCDEEAARLLMDGPKWSPPGSRNGAVEIRFPK